MITGLTLPNSNLAVQDDMWLIVDSDNSEVENFKYVIDVFDGSGNQLIRSKVYPNPTNFKGYFNLGSILRNLPHYNQFSVTPILFDGSFPTVFMNDINFRYDYSVAIGEDVYGTTTLNMEVQDSSFDNFRYDLLDRFQVGFSDYFHKYVTTRPKIAKLGYNENFYVPLYSGGDMQVTFNVYNNAGGYLFNDTVIVGTSATGMAQLNLKLDYLYGNFGAAKDDCENIARYEVIMTNNDLSWSDKFEFTIDCCPRYEVVLLHFLNRFNGFETARFSLVNKLSSDIERKTFQKNDYQFNTDSVTYSNNNIYNESKINYGSKINWKYKLIMDFPTDAEYQWLNQLITSPQIYAEIDGSYYPVTITNTNYEYSKHIFNGLKQFEIEIEMNQQRFGFRR